MSFQEKEERNAGWQKQQESATMAEKYSHLFNYTKMLLSVNIHLF